MTPFILKPPQDLLAQTPELGRMANTLSQCYAYRHAVTQDQLKTTGEALWQSLSVDDTAFRQHLTQAGLNPLSLIIECADAAVQQLPWECLYHPEFGFLGIHPRFTLCRRMSQDNIAPPTLNKGPLKVLLFTSLPDDLDAETGRLDTEAEQGHVLEALLPWIQAGWVTLETPDDGRFSTLRDQLKTGNFHLVFLSGHGKFHHEPINQTAYGEFLFESDAGLGEPIRDQAIAEAFVGSGVQCVVLAACESGKSASDALTGGLTRQLQQVGLAQVIGMRESILDRAGILFARAFCDAVGRKQRVDVALQQARQAITEPLKDATYRDGDCDCLAELSLTQWCLPALYSQDPGQPLIDWDFEPQPPVKGLYHRQLKGITLPGVFIGRRRELRLLGPALYAGQKRRLLLTGSGGQGKTTLAGQLALRLKAQGYLVVTYLAHHEHAWDDFMFNLMMALDKSHTELYESKRPLCTTPARHAEVLLTILVEQTQHQLVLFFDNLEAIQQPDTLALADEQVQTWIKTACDMGDDGPRLLLTSRWKLPDWLSSEYYALTKPGYGDFLRYLQQITEHYPMRKRSQLREVYDALGGNFRGLEFFLKAAETMGLGEEQDFLAQLAQAQEDLQTDMAIERVVALLSGRAKILLHRLCVYVGDVPWDGVFKLAQDLEEPRALLEELVAFSLTEVSMDSWIQRLVYQNDVQVSLWLQNREGDLDVSWYRLAVEYQVYLFETDRGTESQALVVHQALVTADMSHEANVLVRDYLIGRFTLRGLYHALLETWLPPLLASDDLGMKATGLGQTGKLYHHIGAYDTALDYMQQSLTMAKAMGDKKGVGTILNNISQIFYSQGNYDTALDYLQRSLAIVKAIGDDQVESTTLNNIAAIYRAQGNYTDALNYSQKSLAICEAIRNKQGEGVTLNNIATIYLAKGDDDAALNYLQQSLAILKAIGDKQFSGTTLSNISQIFKAQGNYDTALYYLQQALIIDKTTGDKQGEGTTLNNISLIFQAQGNYDRTLDYLQQSLAIGKTIGDKKGVGATLNNISQILVAQGDFNAALDYLQQSLSIAKAIGDLPGLCIRQFNLTHIHLQLERIEIEEANTCFVKVYHLAKQLNEFAALEALDGLAKQLGGDGLSHWEALSQQSLTS